MTDLEIIDAAYADIVKEVWTAFYNGSVAAQSQNDKQQAELRFSNGITLARQVRDRARAILP